MQISLRICAGWSASFCSHKWIITNTFTFSRDEGILFVNKYTICVIKKLLGDQNV